MLSRKAGYFFTAVFAFGIFLRILYLTSFASLPLMDSPAGADINEYYTEALAVLNGFGIPAEQQIHAPLYPYFLAGLLVVTGKNLFLTRFLQSLAGLFAGLLFYAVLRRSFRQEEDERRWIPEIFLVLYACYPPLILWQCDFYSENLLPLFLGASMLFLQTALDRKKWSFFALSGMMSGCAVLAHPFSLAFPAGVLCYLFFRKVSKENFRICLCFGGVFLLTLLPCSVTRSVQARKVVFIQQNSAFNLYLGNHENATGTCCIPPGDEWNRIHEQSGSDPRGADRFFLEKMFLFLKEKPFAWLRLAAKKTILPFYPGELTTWSDVSVLKLLPLHRLIPYSFPLIAVPALAVLILLFRKEEFRNKTRLFLISGISGWIMQIIFLTSGRYRLQLVLAMMAFAAFFLASIPVWTRKKYWKKPFAAFTAGAVIVFLPVHTPDTAKEKAQAEMSLAHAYYQKKDFLRAVQHLENIPHKGSNAWNLLGTIRMEEQDPDSAEQAFRNAEQCYPGHPVTALNLGSIHARRGEFREAYEKYRLAYQRGSAGTASAAAFNTGGIFQKSGDPDSAEKYYLMSLEKDPSFLLPRRNLGILYMERGDFASAENCFRQACSLAPKDPEWHLSLAYLYHVAGRKEDAVKKWKDAEKLAPGTPRVEELRNILQL